MENLRKEQNPGKYWDERPVLQIPAPEPPPPRDPPKQEPEEHRVIILDL